MKLDHPDENATGTLRMNERMSAPGIAECVPDELTASVNDLRAGAIEIIDLKAHMMQTRATGCQEFAQR